MSDWHDDELDEREARERSAEGVRIFGEDADVTRPVARFPLPNTEGPTWSASDDSGVRDPSGPTQLPHWSEPATGEVPRIRPTSESDDDFDSWSSLSGPGASGPRFRTDVGDWSEGDFTQGELAKDDSMSMGALAEGDDFGPPTRRGRQGRRGRRGPAPTPDYNDHRDHGEYAGDPAGDHDDYDDRGDRGRLDGPPEYSPIDADDRHDQADGSRRILTGAIMAAAALAAFAAGRPIAAFLVTVVVGVCAFELYEAFRRAGYHTATIVGLLGCVAIVPIAYNRGERAFPLVAFLVVVFTMLWYLFDVVRARPTVNVALTLLGFSYVGILGGFGGALLQPDPGGTGLLMGVVICVVGYDIVGYFVGSQMGHTKLMPRISPRKTLEGLLAGMIAALVLGGFVGAILHPWADEGVGAGLALGLVVAITAPLGDLVESMLKRDLGVKDLGALLPGHGGFLDRFDAILFALPASYYLALQIFS